MDRRKPGDQFSPNWGPKHFDITVRRRVQLGSGMGVESVRVNTCEELIDAYKSALKAKGPRLIEVMI